MNELIQKATTVFFDLQLSMHSYTSCAELQEANLISNE